MSNQPVPTTEALTVDQLIVKLQSLSWQGQGKFKVAARNFQGDNHFFAKNLEPRVYPEEQLVHLIPSPDHPVPNFNV